MTEPRGQELIKSYKANYGIAADADVTEEMILAHWELEKNLRKELLESTRTNRWEVFEAAYSKLYSELDWLNQLGGANISTDSPAAIYGYWSRLIGSPPVKVYEVGSGKGELIEYLSSCGFECKATEITKERGGKWASPRHNLIWGVSDGIHLDQFEPTNFYDVIISNQVIEHIHPDDLLDHFKGAFAILSNKGRYIFATPHASFGPSDISRVFRRDIPLGMHLKEYTYKEVEAMLKKAGFKEVDAPLRAPKKIRKLFGEGLKPRSSKAYMIYLCFLETLIAKIPSQKWRRKAAKAAKLLLFTTNLMLIAKKGDNGANA